MEQLFDYAQTAAFLSIPKGTLFDWVHKKKIPHIRLGPRLVRFRRSELEEFLKHREVAVEGGAESDA